MFVNAYSTVAYASATAITSYSGPGIPPQPKPTTEFLTASDLLDRMATKRNLKRGDLTNLPIRDFAEFLAEEAEDAEKP